MPIWKIFGRQNENREFVPITTDNADEAIEQATPGTVIVANPDGDSPEVFKSERGGHWSRLTTGEDE